VYQLGSKSETDTLRVCCLICELADTFLFIIAGSSHVGGGTFKSLTSPK